MSQIFKNIEKQLLFERDGYVVIDFISAEDAKLMATKFYEQHTNVPDGFYAASCNPDDKFKQDILNHTQEFFFEAIERNFKNYKVLGGTYLCKAPGEIGKVHVHQDWYVVDEQQFQSATIWVPTADTTEKNGTLRVLPGSHRFFNYYRSPNIEFCYKNIQEHIWENMMTVPVKAGQAFVLNHAVLHASSANKSDRERLVVAYAVTSKNANLCFYHSEKDDYVREVEKFNMPDDFFQLYYNTGERPLFGESLGKFPYTITQVDEPTIKQLITHERRVRQHIPYFINNWKAPRTTNKFLKNLLTKFY
jgi:hypothetical protein